MSNVDVAIWLGIKGGKAAEKEFHDFGRAGKASLAEVREAARALPPHLVAVSRGVSAMRTGVEDFAARSGAVGSVARSFGVAGLAGAAAAVGIGLAAKATYDMGRAAMQMGDEIADSAAQLDVSTDTLQELRFAIHEVGGEYGAADAAISGFKNSVGQAEAGFKRALVPFAKLGFTREQLASMGSMDEKLAAVMDALAAVGDEEERFALANKIGLGAMVPLIDKGAAGMARLRKEAQDLGFVMDAEVVKKLGDANDEFEKSAHIIDVQLKASFAGLAVEIAHGSTALAGLLGKLKELGAEDGPGGSVKLLRDTVTQMVLAAAGGRLGGILGRRLTTAKVDYSSMAAPDRSFDAGGSGGVVDTDAAANAEAARKAAAASLDRYMKDRLSGRLSLIGAQSGSPDRTISQRASDDRLQLELKHAEALREITRQAEEDAKVVGPKVARARAEELRLQDRRVHDAELDNLAEQERRDLEDKRLEQERALADLNDELLSLALAGARTAKERRRLELQGLENRRALERRALEVSLGRDPSLSAGDREKRLGLFDAATDGQAAAVRRSTQGPLEAFRDSLVQTSAEVNEALQQVAVDGLQAISDGLVDATLNAKSFGQVFTRVADQVVAGLERIAIQKLIIGPLAGAIFGSGSGSSLVSALGNGLSAAFGGFNPGQLFGPTGKATGGPVYRGSQHWVGEHGPERVRFDSDGYVFDHATSAAMDQRAQRAQSGGGSGAGPIAVTLNNKSGVALQATAVERRTPQGRGLDIDLVEIMDARVDKGVRDLTDGRRYDGSMAANFGVRRRLNGG